MRKYLHYNKLPAIPLRSRRNAFTLAELVVAVGVLVLMLSLAGQVFNLTIQSTGQATALTKISQQLRALERTLREDLRDVQPGESAILIQGNPVNAYWTAQGQEADTDRATLGGGPANGYPHTADPERETVLPTSAATVVPVLPRADMLMLFTSRTESSYVDPRVTSNMQQVVYGHAELGEYVAKAAPSKNPTCDDTPPTTTGAYQFKALRETAGTGQIFPLDKGYPSPTKLCEVPAEQWHLARRSVLLVPTPPPQLNDPNALIWPNKDGLDHEWLLRGRTDIIWNFNYYQAVFRPKPEAVFSGYDCWQQPLAVLDASNKITFQRSKLDASPPALCANRLGHYLLPNCASFKVEWSLNARSDFVAGRLDGGNEILWFDPGYLADQTKPSKGTDDPLTPLKNAIGALKDRTDPASVARTLALKSLLGDSTAYPGPPSDNVPLHPDERSYSLAQRFGTDVSGIGDCLPGDALAADGRANLVLFAANRAVKGNVTALVPDDIFPGALRITVDVLDAEHRLERPIRHVMVIPVGRS